MTLFIRTKTHKDFSAETPFWRRGYRFRSRTGSTTPDGDVLFAVDEEGRVHDGDSIKQIENDRIEDLFDAVVKIRDEVTPENVWDIVLLGHRLFVQGMGVPRETVQETIRDALGVHK